jgi:hypothetical protein
VVRSDNIIKWTLSSLLIFFVFLWARSYWRLDALSLIGPRSLVGTGASRGAIMVKVAGWYGPFALNKGWRTVFENREHAERLEPSISSGVHEWGSFVVFNCHDGFRWECGFVVPLWLPTILVALPTSQAWRKAKRHRAVHGFPVAKP